MDVGMAQATGLDPDEHLTVARFRHGHVLDTQRLSEMIDDGSLHGALSLIGDGGAAHRGAARLLQARAAMPAG